MTAWLSEAAELEGVAPQAVLAWTYRRFRRVALVASFQVESTVLLHMLAGLGLRPVVVTLDSGRLPYETHDYIEDLRQRFQFDLHVEHPDARELAELVDGPGPNLFRTSVELRYRCCEVRKVRPLKRALVGFDAWITGLRRDQGGSRAPTPVLASDPMHGAIAKVAPLAGWTRADVWRYVQEHSLTVHPLYERGFSSIGCAPCTRPTLPEEDERAGRWWWEADGVKECGLHPAMASG